MSARAARLLALAGGLALAAGRVAAGEVAAGEQEPLRLAEVRARVQAAVAGPENRLAPWRPESTAPEHNPWALPRDLPLVRVAAPWDEGALWIQVPEYAWTTLAGGERESLLFSGRPYAILAAQGRSLPFPPLARAAWEPRDDGGLELARPLAGGPVVRFGVLPGDRMCEIRFGVTNASERALGRTWVQICSGFEKLAALRDQAPETARVLVDGALAGWTEPGEELAWVESVRDPRSCLLTQSCFFLARVRGAERAAASAENVLVLPREVDAGLLAKSSLDGTRHVVFYGPCAEGVMYNAVSPCGHADPVLSGVAPGETRWGVVFVLFHEGELAPLAARLAELDRELRTTAGFLE